MATRYAATVDLTCVQEEDRPLKISLLEEGLNESKPDGAQFKGITNPVAKNVKNKILQLVGYVFSTILDGLSSPLPQNP